MSKDSKKSEDNIVAEYQQGVSIADLAERYGLTTEEVTEQVVKPAGDNTTKTEG